MGVRRLLLIAIPLLLAGCAAGVPGRAPAKPTGAREQRYQATATVLASGDHGPELCLGWVADAFPPLCGGLPITNWGWDQVEGEQAASGTTWGTYRLVGTYGGTRFTVVRAEVPPPTSRPSAVERFEDEPNPACPGPAGGWEVPDPSRRSERYLEPVPRAGRDPTPATGRRRQGAWPAGAGHQHRRVPASGSLSGHARRRSFVDGLPDVGTVPRAELAYVVMAGCRVYGRPRTSRHSTEELRCMR
jgi:hypothetical protein